ncbi:protein trichome birefringence-like 34 [Rutidosis leptorrhynchoides]|uniref:protein trichome birefringence-like 34 n=1 Tax=Rutidosis leptorrhynchoides TaxID=125765 RepID=UPI003A9A2A4E
MGKKHSSSMGSWDMKTMFHCSIIMFFLGGIATFYFYRNNVQEAVVSHDLKVVTLTTTTTITTTNALSDTSNTNEDTQVQETYTNTIEDTQIKKSDPSPNTNEDTQIQKSDTDTQPLNHERSLKIAMPSLTETCDLFSGHWVYDNKSHYPLYKENECSYLHGDLACQTYGRKDSKYQKWRWQPHDCDFPRFDGKMMLEKLTNKRLLFVGDSVNRNQWDSMMCLLHTSIPGEKKLGVGLNKTLYTFRSNDYNISIDYYWAPMLVESNGDDPSNHRLDHRTIRVKSIEKHARHWVDADILIFNSYLWWRLPQVKLLKSPGSLLGGDNQVYDMVDNVRAYKMALNTWSQWVHANINRDRTKMFFMGVTATHSKAEDWGGKHLGTCYKEKEPVKDENYWESGTDPKMLRILESTLGKLKAKGVNVQLVNITQLTQQRKDGHPTLHRRLWRPLTDEQIKNPARTSDCTHWCLPGVPDIWNELLLAYIFSATNTISQ